jgi:hypothetical protein
VASLRIRRTGYFGVARKLKVLVDGQAVGSVGRAAEPLEVSTGTHTVAVKMDWVKSPALEIAFAAGETVVLEARSSLLGQGFELQRVTD